MSDIEFDCPNCGGHLIVDALGAGMQVACPECANPIRVPKLTSPAETDNGVIEYDAFISYRHQEPDRTWAKWLHTQLETYRIPKRIAKERGFARRLRKAFRDEEELPASADLSREIDVALQKSRFLIVVCSPRTPASEWVNKEVVRFREMGRHDRILALLIEGEPTESFPRSLREIRRTLIGSSGMVREKIEEVEPLAADVRNRSGESKRHLRRMARLRLLACILGCRFDDLRQREQERQIRQLTLAGIAMGVVIALMVTLMCVAVYQQRRAVRMGNLAKEREQIALDERGKAETAMQKTKEEKINSDRRLYVSDIRKIQTAWEEADMPRFVDLLNDQRPARTGGVDFRGFEWYYWLKQCHNQLLQLNGHEDSVNAICFSPDSKRVATASDDATVKVWDATTGKKLKTLEENNTAEITSVCFSADGKRIASGSKYKTAVVWDTATGEKSLTLKGHTDSVNCVCFSPDGKRLATGSADLTVKVWAAASGQELLTIKGGQGSIASVCFSPDGKRLVSSGYGYDTTAPRSEQPPLIQPVQVWDTVSGQNLFTLKGIEDPVNCVCFSPDGKRLATASDDRTVKVWDATTGTELFTLEGHRAEVTSVCFSPDGQRLATGSMDMTVKVWDATTGKELVTLGGHTSWVNSVCFSPDGKRLASGSADDTVKVWDATNAEALPFKVGSRRVYFSPNSKRVASYIKDGIEVRDVTSRMRLTVISAVGHHGKNICFSPDGNRLASSEVGGIKVWDATSGKERITLIRNSGEFFNICFSPDGKRLASGFAFYDNRPTKPQSTLQSIQICDTESGKELLSIKESQGASTTLCFSPDGKRIASSNNDMRPAKIWDAENGKQVCTLAHGGQLFCFSPDGKRLALGDSESGGSNPSVKLYDSESGKELLTLKGHSDQVVSFCFSPDGKRIATGSVDKLVKIWDAESGQELLTLKGHKNKVSSVCFRSDGRRLISGDDEGTVRIWDSESKAAVDEETVAEPDTDKDNEVDTPNAKEEDDEQ